MRKKGLDLLRAIAVILVLFRHSNLDHSSLKDFGWLGVDLFFVLSGFLISGLLFKEYKAHNSINIKRFLIRRSFKIFPPFYFFLLTTLSLNYFYGIQHDWIKIVSELFYLQSYAPTIWIHTWSLAVEEHFYLSFSIIMCSLSRKKWVHKKKYFIGSLLFLILFSFLIRLEASYPHRYDAYFSFLKTHLRADGILMGVLLSYLYHFTNWTNHLRRNKSISLLISLLLISPGLYFKAGSFFMNTLGLTSVNLGFAGLVFLSLDIEQYLEHRIFKYLKLPIELFCFIGINSYSIYLWHMNSKKIIYTSFDYSPSVLLFLYLLLSIFLGILMSYLIEKTSLKLRDSLF
ncbi:acyltransferase family protein [Aureispira anguillae]|uniref:Acyltransferase n=1 Tax=Aureispira anguillae TaxID=2864201 RepID=A0A915YJK4_9BACT|nr:acyltransferase [Aureispira anguillae]BDS14288.1 acyltransferase [Aureispira anguillae]